MELAQLNQRIAVVNAESKRLNNERQVSIGKKETLEKQLTDAIQAYNKKYNTELNINNLEAEMQRVIAEKEKEVTKLESAIQYINAGDVDSATKVLGGSSETIATQMTVETPVAQTAQAVQTPVTPAVETPAVEIPAAPAVETPVAPVQTVATPPVMTPPPAAPKLSGLDTSKEDAPKFKVPDLGTPVAKPTNSLSGLDVEEDVPVSSGIGAPPVVGAPPVMGAQPKAPMSFNAILGGQAFRPQGEN